MGYDGMNNKKMIICSLLSGDTKVAAKKLPRRLRALSFTHKNLTCSYDQVLFLDFTSGLVCYNMMYNKIFDNSFI